MSALVDKFPESVVKYYLETTRFRLQLDKAFVPVCDAKYSKVEAKSKELIQKLINSKKKFLFSIILHNDEKIFAHWYNQLILFLSWLPDDTVFISIREYKSKDRTPIW